MFCIKLLAVFNGLLIFGNGLPIDENQNGVAVESEIQGVDAGHVFVETEFQGVDAGHVFVDPEFHGVDSGHIFVEPEFQGVDAGHVFVEPEFHGVDAGHVFVEPEFQGVDAGHVYVEPEFQGVDAGHVFVEPEFQGVDAGHVYVEPEFQGVDAGHVYVEPEFQGVDTGNTFVEPESISSEESTSQKVDETDGTTSSTVYFESIPATERSAFLRYHLALALKGNTDSFNPYVAVSTKDGYNFETKVPAPENFTINLYEWMKKSYDITDNDLLNFVTFGQICFPSGTCIDPDDVGAICCPF